MDIFDPRRVDMARSVILLTAAVAAGVSAAAYGHVVYGSWLALGGAAYVLFITFCGALNRGDSPHHSAVIVADSLLITAIVWITGGGHSEYFLLYYLPILSAGLRMNVRGGIGASLLASALFTFATLTAPSGQPHFASDIIGVFTICVPAMVLVVMFGMLKRQVTLADHLRDTLHDSLGRVSAVYDVAHAANIGADLTGVLSIILDRAARLTSSTGGSIFLLTSQGELSPAASITNEGKGDAQACALPIAPAERALSQQTPIVAEVETQAGDESGRSAETTADAIYVPLTTAPGPIGVLALSCPPRNKTLRRQLDFLASLGAEAALAIENARLRAELNRLAITDTLTGLPNRREVEKRLEAARDAGQDVSLLMIDLDNLKVVNDTYGHAVGDDVLRALGKMLESEIQAGQTAGRIGGDEFTVVLPETSPEEALSLANHLVRSFSATLRGWQSLPDAEAIAALVGISVGITSSTNGDLPRELTARGDAALYEAKRMGKNRAFLGASPGEPQLHHFGTSSG